MPVQDWYLPPPVEDALRRAGLWYVTRQERNGLEVEHLEAGPAAIHRIGEELRRLARPVFGKGRTARREVARSLSDPGSALRREVDEVLPRVSDSSPEMFRLHVAVVSRLLERIDEEFPSPGRTTAGFVETPTGAVRHYLPVPSAATFLACLPLPGRLLAGVPWTDLPRVVTNVAGGRVPGISVLQALLALRTGAASLGLESSDLACLGPRILRELARVEEEGGSTSCAHALALVGHLDAEASAALVDAGDHLCIAGPKGIGHTFRRIHRRLRLAGRRGLRRRMSVQGHGAGFDVVSREYLEGAMADAVAFDVALDAAVCVSGTFLCAREVLVEGEEREVRVFGERVLDHAHGLRLRLDGGPRPEATGAYDQTPVLCRVADLDRDLPRLLGVGKRSGALHSAGVAVPLSRLIPIADRLGRAGVRRIVPVGALWDPTTGLESWGRFLSPTDVADRRCGWWTSLTCRDPDADVRASRQRAERLLDMQDRPAEPAAFPHACRAAS